MSTIDWKEELKRLERQFDGLPPEPTPAELPRSRVSHLQEGREITPLGVWTRLIFVAALGGALPFWPYAHYCGMGLYAYMGAGAMIAIGGIWVTMGSWRCRTATAHLLSILLIAWGIGVIGYEVLPRIGYAKTDSAHPPQWSCAIPRAGR